MIIKALSKSPWGAGLVNTDIGSDDRLAQHKPSNPCTCIKQNYTPLSLPCNFPRRSRLTSSRPNAILTILVALITPYMPNPLIFLLLLLLLPPPAHTMCYATGTAQHRVPTQLPASDNHIN
eukprot:1140119-Pelagomonas_calceolata.AAC.1